jgi:hypothetical protein
VCYGTGEVSMKSDHFKLYPEKFLSSLDVQVMSISEFGAFCKILFASWIQEMPCFIAHDENTLSRLCGISIDEWKKISPVVLKKFRIDGMFMHNETLLAVWKSQQKGKKEINRIEYIQSAALLNYSWDQFWNDYDKKVGSVERLVPKWIKLSDKERQLIREYIPKYKLSTPDKKYRKNPETFLNQKGWMHEIIISQTNQKKVLLHGGKRIEA